MIYTYSMGIGAQCVHGVGLCVIPTHKNNHHPLALRHGPLAFVSALLLTVKIAALSLVAITPSTADLSTITTERIIQLTNIERQKAGRGEVKLNAKLANAALQKGQHMLQEDYFAHISPSGVTPWFWMSKVGYSYTVAGENLAIDFTSAEGVVTAWMNSPAHKDNLLLPDYTDIGIGVVTGEFQGGTSTIVVQMFGRPPQAVLDTLPPSTAPTVKSTISTPLPSASPTLSPIPTLVPISSSPPDTPAPRTPRITLASPIVSSSVELMIEGDPASLVHILVNSQERQVVTLSAQGTTQQKLSLTEIPDGTLTLRAYASNSSPKHSEVSEALQFIKDTRSPSREKFNIAFAVSPLTDSHAVAVRLSGSDADDLVISDNSEHYTFLNDTWKTIPTPPAAFTVELKDTAENLTSVPVTTLSPQFSIPEDQSFPHEAAYYWQMSRRIAAGIFSLIFVLLCLAIFIRVRIQHVSLITHASLVLLLAFTLFLF